MAMTKIQLTKIQRVSAALVRKGLIVKTKRTRSGQPVYVACKYATPEEIAEQQEERRK
jgi:predicted transcriptional regulator